MNEVRRRAVKAVGEEEGRSLHWGTWNAFEKILRPVCAVVLVEDD